MSKRPRRSDGEIDQLSKLQRETQSDASKFNARVLKKLQEAFAVDPAVDLAAVLPRNYAERLSNRKIDASKNVTSPAPPIIRPRDLSEPDTEIDSLSLPEGDLTVIFPLSDSVNDILAIKKRLPTGPQSAETVQAFARMIRRGEVLWKYEHGHRMVVKCGPDVIVKIAATEDHAEFTNLQYLERHCPEIPAPKPLGLVTLGSMSYIFMSFIPGITIREVWKDMQHDQKISFRDQFNELLLKLRSLPYPDNMFLGAVSGEGCKDTRRHTRVSERSIKDSAEFEDFQFSNPHFGGSVYIDFLRHLSPTDSQRIVFTHGDLNNGNIMVRLGKSGQYEITGLIDWEARSRFATGCDRNSRAAQYSSEYINDHNSVARKGEPAAFSLVGPEWITGGGSLLEIYATFWHILVVC